MPPWEAGYNHKSESVRFVDVNDTEMFEAQTSDNPRRQHTIQFTLD
jgi:hypothetical protein